jgi:hypothetical protein
MTMKEKEWLASDDPHSLLRFLQKRGVHRQTSGRRRLRLVGCACVRHVGQHLTRRGWRWVDLGEQIADGLLKPAQQKKIEAEPTDELDGQRADHWADDAAHSTTASAVMVAAERATAGAASAVGNAAWLPKEDFAAAARARDAECRAQAELVRDVFGNPFRKVKFDKKWSTSSAVQLARRVYDSRDFSAMPILADALQDAGCDNTDILDHCRGPGPHVRGCWVVDLVLGKA